MKRTTLDESMGERRANGEGSLSRIEELSGLTRPIRQSTSIVIPTLGRPVLERSLYSIAIGTQWPAKLIVVDQGRASVVADWLRRLADLGLPTDYLPSSERGRAIGVNRGLARVESPFVAITDDDCFVDSRWLETMADRLECDAETIITGRIETAEGSGVITVVRSDRSVVHRRQTLRFSGASGGNLGMAMAVIEHLGDFDEDPRVRTAEDTEWSYRALRAGVPILYAPEVCVTHHGWRNEAERTRQYESYARSHGAFYGKYLRRGDWFIALRVLIHHARALRRWMRGRLSGEAEQARLGKSYFTKLLPGILEGWRSRESSS